MHPFRSPPRRVAGVCDIDGCTSSMDVQVLDNTVLTTPNTTPLRLCEKHGLTFTRAGLVALGAKLPEVTA